MTDRDAIALTLYGEARGEPFVGRLAVACVIRNRKLDGRWGNTYESVCLWPRQFSCWNEQDPNRQLLMSLALGATGRPPTFNSILLECYVLADVLLNVAVLGQIRNATHYYAHARMDPPEWAVGKTPVYEIGGHRFYEDIA